MLFDLQKFMGPFNAPPLRGNVLAVQGYMWHAKYVFVYLGPIHDIL